MIKGSRIKLTDNERWLHLEVEGDAELAHLIPGCAPVLASVLRPRVLHQQHVGHRVKPRPVAHWLQQVAVDVKPTGTKHIWAIVILTEPVFFTAF